MLGVPTQNLDIYTTPDTAKASIKLMQVKITGVRVKVDKDVNHYSLVFKASFGPAGKNELEFVEHWRNSQRFITFERVEPGLELDTDEKDDDETPAKRPAPMWDDGQQPQAAAESDDAREVGSKRPMRRKHATGSAKGKPNGAEAHP